MRHAAIVAVSVLVLAAACGGRSPASPTPASGPLRLGLAGQSNSELLRPFLSQVANVAAFHYEVTTIAPCWDVSGSCWAALRSQLHQPLDAFIWSQGESDVLNQTPDYGPRTPGSYGPALAGLMARIREAAGNPNLLILVMQKGPWAAQWAAQGITVDLETQAWIQSDPHAVLVPTNDLDWRNDGIHMLDSGYVAASSRIIAAVTSAKRPARGIMRSEGTHDN